MEVQAFYSAWEVREQDRDFQVLGDFQMSADIVMSQEEAMEVMDIRGELEFSYMCFSGDASLKFAKDNIQSDLDVSVIFKASASGRKLQMSIAELNLLELKDTIS